MSRIRLLRAALACLFFALVGFCISLWANGLDTMSRDGLIINTHDQLKAAGGGVAIMPHYTGSRTQYFCGWAIYRLNAEGKQLVTDPQAHWADYGKKVFSTSSADGSTPAERSRNALAAAKQWVAEQGWYDGEWKRNRQRDYVPKEINDRFPQIKN